ncbi:YutD family protein [Enterococcus sp. BWB1-3]|uniref:YutD family protein n=1 Tax=unclassified Enterococcus TaxID=2608891 RepID=UPI0019234C34|nr:MULTISPECIES: YutD family protein [unclassified Enterococcus]MBL1230104.1 YutD family protein [Enterococcus sp. BWB1-3]MCB5950993.1 YutD family protein [Enterococcus sp. BWT-B8]MCB5955177.1 YutD family protein [Enterococcus sp. CWB-B31]
MVTEKTEEKNELTAEIAAVIEEINEEPAKTKQRGEVVTAVDESQIMIGDRQYMLVKNHRDAFDAEKIGERFSDILSRYDFIVGDWGYDQLRLKGFFEAGNRKASPDQRIDSLEDYLYEFCNFGCAYFVLERIGGKREKQGLKRKRNNKRSNYRNNNQAHTEEKKGPAKNQKDFKKNKPVIRNRKENTGANQQAAEKKPEKKEANNNRSFTIRQREE